MAIMRTEVARVVGKRASYLKKIWTPTMKEALVCRRETDNFHDRLAAAVMKESNVVGHVPKKVSSICSLFLRFGTIRCEVIGNVHLTWIKAAWKFHVN